MPQTNKNYEQGTVLRGPAREDKPVAIPTGESPIPIFPPDAIVGSIGDLARELAAGTEVPIEFLYAAGLTMLGAYAGTGLTLAAGMQVEPRLYTVLLGESYSVKKSTAMKRMIDFFGTLNVEQKPHVVYGLGSAEGLARELEVTPHLLLAYDELRSFVDKCHVKGSTLLPMVTSLFEGNHWENAVKNKYASTNVEDAHLSLIACCTRDTYSDIWQRDAIAIGLPNRLFIVNAERKEKVAWPGLPNEEHLALLRKEIHEQLAGLPVEYSIDAPGKAAWEAWYQQLPESEHSRRLDTIGFRLMGLLALTEHKDCIDESTVQRVISILNYEFDMRRLTDPIDADNTIAKLENLVRRWLSKRPLSRRDLQRCTNANRVGMWAFEAALKNLRQSGEIVTRGDCFAMTEAIA